jgi:hypothetical protein
MSVYEINPIQDARWNDLLERDTRASVFHSRGWLQALQRTYGYEPVAFTTSASNQDLKSGIVFCQVSSWLTGRRLVSLPFSDHCEPLLSGSEDSDEIASFLQSELKRRKLKYIEIRPLSALVAASGFGSESEKFCFHKLDLSPTTEQLFNSFHKGSLRRRIQHAVAEDLEYESGRTRELLDKFYGLFVLTRKRHGLPPSPVQWFRTLSDCVGDILQVHIASKSGKPVAGIVTLTYNNCIVYKYGGSDAEFNKLAGTPFLFWMVIQEAKRAGIQEFDFGRSDMDNEGLITFKNHFAAIQSVLTYRRLPSAEWRTSEARHGSRLRKKLFAAVPDLVRIQAGKLLYRHVG